MSAAQKKERRFHYAYVVAAAMFLMYILSVFTHGSDSLFLTPVMEEFGCTRAQWGMIMTIWMIGTGFTMGPIGKLYEKVDGRIMQAVAAIGIAAHCAIRALSTNIYWWWAGAVLLSLVFPMVLNLMLPTFTTRWFAKRVGLVMSICSMAQGLANSVFSVIIANLISNHGWRFAMWVEAALALIIGIPVALLFRSRPSDLGLQPLGAEEIASADGTVTTAKPRGMSYKEAMKNPVFWMLFAAIGISTFAGNMYGYISAFLQTPAVGYTVVAAGAVLSAQSLGQTIGKLTMGTLSDIIGGRKVALMSCTFLIVGILGISFLAGGVAPVVISGCAFLVGYNTAAGNLVWPMITKETFGLLEYTAIWAALVRALALVGAFASTVWGLVADMAGGDYRVAFVGGAVLMLVPMALIIMTAKPAKEYPQTKWHE